MSQEDEGVAAGVRLGEKDTREPACSVNERTIP
jgi:hypothetical protein